MNPERLMTQLAGELQQLAGQGFTRIHICLYHDRVKARRSDHTDKRHKVFKYYRKNPLDEGLTSAQWSALVKSIIIYMERLKQCQPPQKHLPDQNATFF